MREERRREDLYNMGRFDESLRFLHQKVDKINGGLEDHHKRIDSLERTRDTQKGEQKALPGNKELIKWLLIASSLGGALGNGDHIWQFFTG